MFKTFNKTMLLMLLGTLSVLNASAPNPIKEDTIGVADINNTAVRINFEDNSTNENGFHISGDGIDLDLPANDETVNKYVYTNLENLDCNKIYIIDIWSYNDDGNSSKESKAFNIHSTFGVSCPVTPTPTPNPPGPYIGVTDINDTAVRINFLDNSDNETGFRIFGSDDINVTLPPNNETVDQNVYANLTGLICNHTYTIQALAFNGSEDSLPTDVRAFNIHTTFGVPCDGNHIPVANAGADQTVADSTQVQLDGSASSDADGDPLIYQWTMTSKPNDSNATLSDATLEKPTFVADVNGTYDIQLIVNDGHVDSVADTVVISSSDTNISCDTTTAITREELIQKIGNGEDVTNVNTCAITDMSHLFDPSIYTEEQNETVSNFNQDISGWDTSNVTTMAGMFSGKVLNEYNWRTHHPFFNQPIGKWDVSHVTDMSNMFAGCEAFNQPLGNWNVSNVTNMWNMFGESNFNQDISNWDVSKVTDMSEMFSISPFNQPIGNWDVSKVTNIKCMFYMASKFNQPIGNWDVSNVINMQGVFAKSSFNQPLNSWDVSNVTTMVDMFAESPFNQPLNSWDVSNVINISWMFISNKAFNQPLNNWNTSNVTNMRNIFWGAEAFNQPIGNWDTSKVTDMQQMFTLAKAFNQNINDWDTSKVTNMQYMFNGASSFNQPLDKWDVSKVTNMRVMFHSATSFNQDISGWDISNVTDIDWMFAYATAFNQDISGWDTSKVTEISSMFNGATAFSNHDLSGWDVNNVTNHTDFSLNWGTGNIEPNWN